MMTSILQMKTKYEFCFQLNGDLTFKDHQGNVS